MKIQCNVCETAEATVLCCADEAALCDSCDATVHAANKLASKHHRVSLSHSSDDMPRCDICQDTVGYFFCLEDRALLCRKCDIAIHTANSFVSSHQRFLLTGVKVGLQGTETGSSSSAARTQSGGKGTDADNRAPPTQYDRVENGQNGCAVLTHSNKRDMPMSVSDYDEIDPLQNCTLEDLTHSRMSFAGGSDGGNLSQWAIDEFMGMSDFCQNYNFTRNGSSKADSGKFGSSDSSTILRSLEDDLDSNGLLGQVPDVSWSEPQIPSPPTSSGIYWLRNSQELVDNSLYVPDISWSQQHQPKHDASKGRRQF